MKNFSLYYNEHLISLTVIEMGTDLNVSIYGGDKPHIGAVALGIPRPSSNNPLKTSSTVSVLTLCGHKEDVIVNNTAKRISSALNKVVVVSCGIHIPNITVNDINNINLTIDELVNNLINWLK